VFKVLLCDVVLANEVFIHALVPSVTTTYQALETPAGSRCSSIFDVTPLSLTVCHHLLSSSSFHWVTVWCSGNTLVSINAFALHSARL